MRQLDPETKLRRAHIRLMKHPETCLYSGVILFGKATIEESASVPTACTNGVDVRYNRAFIEPLDEKELAGLVLHENLHKALRHLMRYRGLCKEDPELANAAMDYVVNDIIVSLKDKDLARLPQGGLYDARFHNWSVLDVWEYLKQGSNGKTASKQGDGLPTGKAERRNGKVRICNEEFSLQGTDQHDATSTEQMTPDELSGLEAKITEALQQGGLLAGRMGAKVPRAIKDSLAPPVDWRREMLEFVSSSCGGHDELTWRAYNRKRLADDLYFPSTEDETIREVVVSIDTSGSITGDILSDFAAQLAHICRLVKPDRVRVLWWDTAVHGEQIFNPGQYDNLKSLLKPQGGGGTRAGCVADYVYTKKLKPDCIVMFTDGYTEQPINWRGVTAATLWLVTQKDDFIAPAGHRRVKMPRTI